MAGIPTTPVFTGAGVLTAILAITLAVTIMGIGAVTTAIIIIMVFTTGITAVTAGAIIITAAPAGFTTARTGQQPQFPTEVPASTALLARCGLAAIAKTKSSSLHG